MDSYAIKYRPKRFEELIGQDHIISFLRGMLISGGLNRTLMIHGPWGSGKTTTARLIARYINCTEKVDTTDPPCGMCTACRHDVDYTEVNAAESRGIDTIRGLIEESQHMPHGEYRIIVLDEAHQLTPQAVQAMLKVTEEPPEHTLWILCTTDPQRFPPALASRCLKLNVHRLTIDESVQILRRIATIEELGERFDDDFLRMIATAVDGVPRNAIMTLEAVVNAMRHRQDVGDAADFVMSIAQETVGVTPERLVAQYLTSIYAGRVTNALLALQEVVNDTAFIDIIMTFHRHAIFYRASPKLHDDSMRSWYGQLPKDQDVDMLTDVNEMIVRTAGEIRGFQGNAKDLLLDLTMRAARRVRSSL